MLSKAQISLINSLQQKKYRNQHNIFVVEGIKSVLEFVDSRYNVQKIFTTMHADAKLGELPQIIKKEVITEDEFNKISNLKNPQGALALVEIPKVKEFDYNELKGKHSIVLDDIQDPGNLGTIIRTAEWFGIKHIICSLGTVDAYNPKVVQATMGSLSRVQIDYLDIENLIENTLLPTFGALLDGESVYQTNFTSEGLIIMGNEGNGIRENLLPKITKAVTIPRIGEAESLNVAVAATIFCSEVARQKLQSNTHGKY